MERIIKEALSASKTYSEYRELIDSLMEDGKTTGPNQSEDFLHYTNLNVTRMRRLDKTTRIEDEVLKVIQNVKKEQIWLIITEAWCGDAAQVIPVVEAIARLNEMVQTRYVLRDEHTELIDLFLTNGGRSIPMILLLNTEKDQVYATWGPRPSELQEVIDANKASDIPKPYSELSTDVQRWYAKDKTLSTQREFSSVIR
jgi:hypothetical protein